MKSAPLVPELAAAAFDGLDDHAITHAARRDVLADHAADVRVPLRGDKVEAPDVEELLVLLAREELALGSRPLGVRVSALRKIFYDSQGWDAFLLPGAAHAPSPYAHQPLPPHEQPSGMVRQLSLPGGHVLTLDRTETRAVDSQGDTPAVALCQEARLADGAVSDVGHALCGLDAAFHPDVVGLPGLVGVRRNVDAVTWAGDLGSWLAEVQIQAVAAGSIDGPTIDRLRVLMAPGQDNLGNLDAFSLQPWLEGQPAGASVVERLRGFYLGSAAPTHANPRGRFAGAALRLGLGRLQGDAFEREATFVPRATSDVAGAAGLYFAMLVAPRPRQAYAFALGLARNPGAGVLVRAFVTSLAKAVRDEGEAVRT